MKRHAYSVFFDATKDRPHFGLPGQFDCYLDAVRAVRKAFPGACVSSFGIGVNGCRFPILSSTHSKITIGEVIADHLFA